MTSPSVLIKIGLILGAVLLASAWLWSAVSQPAAKASWYPLHTAIPEISLGSVAGLISALFMAYLSYSLPSAIQLREKLLQVLDFKQLTFWQVLAFGGLAAIPEEAFFRGAMQPTLGLILTALIFASLHALSPTYFLYAFLAGLSLGWLVIWRGDLWAATAAHWVYDSTLIFIWRIQQNKTIIELKDVGI